MTDVAAPTYRVSPMQQHVSRLSAALRTTAYAQLRASVPDEVTEDALRQALSAVAQRHEALRTSLRPLPGADGSLVQAVSPAAPELRVVDLRGDGAAGDPAALEPVCAEDREGLGELAAPPLRATLVRTGPGSVLVLTSPAAVADAASLALVAGELGALLAGGQPAGEPAQYPDVAAWQSELLHDEAFAEDRAAWAPALDADVLAAADQVLRDPDAPAAAPAGAAAGGGPQVLDVPLAAADGSALAARAAGWPARLPALLTAVLAVLVRRICDGGDVAVAVGVDGRTQSSLATAVGPFARMVPVALTGSDEDELTGTVTRVAADLRRAAELVDHLDPRLVRGDRPLAVGIRWVDLRTPAGAGLAVLDQAGWDGGVAVQLEVLQSDAGLTARFRYAPAAVGAQRMSRIAGWYAAMLRGLATGGLRTVGELSAADPAAAAAAVLTGPEAGHPVDRRLSDLIAEQAARSPDAVAVTFETEDVTYAELLGRARSIARRLVERGVTPGSAVVLRLDRTVDLVPCVLAVLEAGAAFVPMDTQQPLERVRHVVGDVGAALVLAPARLAGEDVGAPVAAVDGPDGIAAGAGGDGSPLGVSGATDVAYVMYTSGTTGTPQGVAVPHRGLVNYLGWAAAEYRLTEGSGSLVHSSIGFDLTLTALLAPLLVGQRVVVLPDQAGIAGLAGMLRRPYDVSLLKVTPTHLAVLADLLGADPVTARVRTLVVGGEELRADLLHPFRAPGTETRIVNEYGPTETVVGSTSYVLPADFPDEGSVPIGTPIANTRVYLLDDALRPVPDGLPGEICIGGDGVSLGYHGRPEATAERFVPDPVRPGTGPVYRTGDRARRRDDGVLVYLGRRDAQVKIRGVRVEPAETEAVLRTHPRVGQAVVVADEQDDPGRSSPLAGRMRLIGYVVPAAGDRPGADELVDWCRERLPEVFVPARIVWLDRVPLTVGGKLDRAALPRPGETEQNRPAYAPAETATEQVLVESVEKVLGIEGVGVDDNYFVLGGDSIRSVMIASRAQARGVDVSVALIHRYPTVRTCAQQVDAGTETAEDATTAPFALVSDEDRALMPAEVEDAFPLNLLQEGMIFHRDFAAKSAVYHAIASVRLRAPFDEDVLRMVVHRLVERHPMLRTSFDQTTFSKPLQLVHITFRDPLQVEDLRELDPDERDRRVLGRVESERNRGFELEEYPLIRFFVHRLTEESWQFTYGFHHEIVDGWSEALMVTELFSHYFSVVFDEPETIRPPRSTMRDAVALELQALQDRRHYDFWERYLEDVTLMRLPRKGAAGPRADKGAREIVRIPVQVPLELSDRLKEVAHAAAVPLKSVLLGSHMAVMSHYGGHRDTLSYTVTNGRPETADGTTAIGLFVNSLALRVRMPGGSWRELIQATLQSERASLPHRRLPMAELKRHQGNEPLAETLFFFTDYHVFQVLERWHDRGVTAESNELYGESTFPFCAIFRTNRETGQLEVRLEYDSLQFADDVMLAMADTYAEVLRRIAADLDGPYHVPSLLPPTEHERLRGWLASEPVTAEAELRQGAHQLVEAQAAARPDAVALESADDSVSYGALDARANAAAHRLRAAGVGAGDLVGLLGDRSVDAFVAMLGVLKAGAAYLPLDVSSPPARVESVLADSGARILLAAGGTVPEGTVPAGVTVVDLAALGAGGTPAERRRSHRPASPLSAAYVIYTSGSTGTPKGVVVEHRQLVASTLARRAYEVPPERFLLLSSLAFDSSVAGIYWTLATGGTLVLLPEGAQLDPVAAVDFAAQRQPSATLAIPSLYASLLEQAAPEDLAALRTVVVAGEVCPRELLVAHGEWAPQALFSNEYGPTETTVWATSWAGTADGAGQSVPIGRPVPGASAAVLSPFGLSVPVGVVGELYVGGAGVSRGYLGQPALTAERFGPDPDGDRPGARRYRTGDLVRHLPDGRLDFVSRVDHQIKVRGFRVETGDIESALARHPSVARSFVTAREQSPGNQSLVAYVLPAEGAEADIGVLQQHLRDLLPKYMIPSVFVVLDAVPLTPTGKVDRSALAAPGRSHAVPAAAYRAPESEIEQLMADVWSDVLGPERIGLDDNFFDLGGESLRAMKLTTRTNKVLGTKLSVRVLFDAPTLASFARAVELTRAAEAVGAAPPPAEA